VRYSLRYNAPNMWPAGGLEAEELQTVRYSLRYNAPKMWPAGGLEEEELICPKHVELIGIINKQLLLYLVGCLLYYRYCRRLHCLFYGVYLSHCNVELYRTGV
jgi:hypothetical protein